MLIMNYEIIVRSVAKIRIMRALMGGQSLSVDSFSWIIKRGRKRLLPSSCGPTRA